MRRILPLAATAVILFALGAGSRFVAATYGGGPTPPPVRTEQAPEALRGRLRLVEGIPVLRLKGTPREIGRQHGQVLRPQIHFLKREYYEKLAVPPIGRKQVVAWATAVEPYLSERVKEELRGVAEGCGLSYREALEVNAVVDRLQTVFCSTVVAAGEATKDGGVYFGRNLDFPGRDLLHRMTVVIVYETEGAVPVAAVTWPGLIGALSGMNAKGLAGATMMIHDGEDLQPGIPYPIMYREALARAETIEQVQAYFESATRTCPNNFMVVEPDGDAAVFEWDQTRVVRRPARGGALCSTNHFRSDALKDVGWPMGKGRYETLERFLAEERGRIDLEHVRRALADVATPWFLNVQSMIFRPDRRELFLSVGGQLPAAKQPFARIGAEILFGPLPAGD